MNKQEYILELIHKGHSDEEIELLVKDKFPEEEIIPFMAASPNYPTLMGNEYSGLSQTIVSNDDEYMNILNPTNDKFFTDLYFSNLNQNGIKHTPFIIEFNTSYTTHDARNWIMFSKTDSSSAPANWVEFATTKIWTFEKGHKYQFENGVDPVDLGSSSSSTTPSSITPQEAFDQTWDAVKKVNENISAKFTQYSDKLISNDSTSTDEAYIGTGYKGGQHYGSNGSDIFIGDNATEINIGPSAQSIYIGTGATNSTFVQLKGLHDTSDNNRQSSISVEYSNGTTMVQDEIKFKQLIDVAKSLTGSTITFEDGTTLVL